MREIRVGNAANTAARLRGRIACNQARHRAFPRFVLDVLDARADDAALDLGPGLGMQLLPVAERVRRAVGVDTSPEMVAELRARLPQPSAHVVVADMDEIGSLDLGAPFTLIYAVYSLHYSRDPALLVRTAAELLQGPRARMVVVGPDTGNNERWFEDLGRIYEMDAAALETSEICRREILPAFEAAFRTVRCRTYRDHIRFSSLEQLVGYYDASAPHCRPDRREAARRHFGAIIEREGSYEIAKHSLALVGIR